MRTADERQRMLIECQIKMVQDVMDRNREVRNDGVHGVSLADFVIHVLRTKSLSEVNA
jgi:hypothetical protein